MGRAILINQQMLYYLSESQVLDNRGDFFRLAVVEVKDAALAARAGVALRGQSGG